MKKITKPAYAVFIPKKQLTAHIAAHPNFLEGIKKVRGLYLSSSYDDECGVIGSFNMNFIVSIAKIFGINRIMKTNITVTVS